MRVMCIGKEVFVVLSSVIPGLGFLVTSFSLLRMSPSQAVKTSAC